MGITYTALKGNTAVMADRCNKSPATQTIAVNGHYRPIWFIAQGRRKKKQNKESAHTQKSEPKNRNYNHFNCDARDGTATSR